MNHPSNRAERLRKKHEQEYKEAFKKKQTEPNSARNRFKRLKEELKVEEAENDLRNAVLQDI